MKREIEQVIVVGNRPYQAPERATIWNAPRPLYGQVTWSGHCLCGVLYAAQDPNDPDPLIPYETILEENARQRAVELTFISRDEFVRRAKEWFDPLARSRDFDPAEFGEGEITDMFLANHEEQRYIIP